MSKRAAERLFQRAILAMAVMLLSSTVAHASTYYVRTDGNDVNDGLSNSVQGAWRTIDWAADHVAAGDTVRVQAGTYVEVASPGVSGWSGNTVTLVADGTVTTCGMTFSSKSYIRVIGFTMDGSVSGCTLATYRVSVSGTNTGLEFWNNNLANSNHGFLMMDPADRCNACIIIGGSISHINNHTHGITLTGDDSLIGYVSFDQIDYLGVVPSGHRLRFINLNFSNFIQSGPTVHPDFFYIQGGNTFGYSNSLVESMFGLGTPTAHDNKTFHAQNQQANAWNDDIWRFNVVSNMGAGYFSTYAWDVGAGAINRWRHYNNTIVNCVRAPESNTLDFNNCGNINLSVGGGTTYIFNNLFQQAWAPIVTSNIVVWSESAGAFVKDYNLAFDPDGPVSFLSQWTNQAHDQSNVNPQLNDVANDDLTLRSASGARGLGGPLTTTSGSGSASTSLTVAPNTGSFFVGNNSGNLPQYGGNLVPGDFITVGSTTVQVSSVSGDTLALASPISWSTGAPVYFGSSSTIDIGAYPYKSGGYTLNATYAQSNGNVTITPNDASLVRFVVCYSDRVPYAADNSSPYTCAAPATGTFSARVYPRYASKTLWVTVGGGPSAPTNVIIR